RCLRRRLRRCLRRRSGLLSLLGRGGDEFGVVSRPCCPCCLRGNRRAGGLGFALSAFGPFAHGGVCRPRDAKPVQPNRHRRQLFVDAVNHIQRSPTRVPRVSVRPCHFAFSNLLGQLALRLGERGALRRDRKSVV